MDEKQDYSPPSELQAPHHGAASTYIKPQLRRPHDPDVTFEEYHYYALKTREEEKHYEAPKLNWRQLMNRQRNGQEHGDGHDGDVKVVSDEMFGTHGNRLEISDEEWRNASRAFRTAGWGACEQIDLLVN